MKSLRRSFAAFAAVSLFAVAAFAADPSGTWKWSQPGRGGGAPRESTLTLAVKDGKLTGSLATPGRGGDPVTTEITNASLKDDTVTFTIEREFNGNKVVANYTGKIDGDTIKGSIEGPGRNGETMKRDWEAKRAK